MAVLLTFGVGCSHYVAREDLPAQPTEHEMDQVMWHWAVQYLREPGTASIERISEPVPGYTVTYFQFPDEAGWTWDAAVNARNGFGGFTGWKGQRFLYLRGGKWWSYPYKPGRNCGIEKAKGVK
jgi:hypothetical protein